MLPACNRGAGANVHLFDVCLTPPVPPKPVPYVNRAYNITGFLFVPNVFITMLPAHNLGTWLMASTGDEPGTLHWTIMGWSRYITGNPIVFVGMLPAVHLTVRTISNRGNAMKGICAQPSAVNVMYTSAEALRDPSATERASDLLPFAGARADALVSSSREGGTLRIRLEKIASGTPLAVRRLLAEGEPPEHVVLDLRGNPGGDLDAAVRLVELFVPFGSRVAMVEDAYGDRVERRTRGEPIFTGPLSIEVDALTASAAEVVATALAKLERASIVGGPSYGKGTIQTFVDGEGFGTVGRVLDPDGAPIGSEVLEHREIPDYRLANATWEMPLELSTNVM
ncbi:MAG: PAAR-like domain-containing protein [Polyangiaceae bacterium]